MDDGSNARWRSVRIARVAPAAAMALLLAMTTACGGSASAKTSTPAAPPAAKAAAPSPQVLTVKYEIKGGKVISGPDSLNAKLGEQVVIQVVSDAADELHVHGYDKESEVGAGTPAQVSFVANLAGVFDVELHKTDLKLAELRVQ
jgi:hypothetical protein